MTARVLGPCLAVLLLAACEREVPTAYDDSNSVVSLTAQSAVSFPNVLPLPTGFQPEGIATGRGTEFFVGSFPLGAVYKGDLRDGNGQLLVAPDPGNRQVVGLSHDARTNQLFAAGGLLGQAHVFDGGTGAVLATYQLTAPCPDVPCTLVNDAIVTRDAVYFTDSFRPSIYRVPLGPGGALISGAAPLEIPLSGDFVFDAVCPIFPQPANANGIDATPDGKVLVIVNLCTGQLFRVDPSSGHARLIDLGGAALPYGDGILLDGFDLYVVQNLLNQIAVVELAPDLASGVVTGTITDPAFRIPATVAEFGRSLYAVNARFDVAPPDVPSPTVEFEVVRVNKR
jgi:sugar lactone lactonase YvrE